MIYNENFKKCVDNAISTQNNSLYYIGTGNPNAKILIVGKELAIDPRNSGQIETEINKNIEQWQENIKENFSSDNLKYYSEGRDNNPLFPYKGQKRIRNKNKNGGTSNTWLNYQKLHDNIYCTKALEINFHKDFFLTEINQHPSQSSQEQDNNQRNESIECRKKFIHDSDFFQSFPITILTCKAYIAESQLQQLFIKGLTKGRAVLDEKGNHCTIYYSEDNSKAVIYTRQLSNSLKKELLEKISSEIQGFCNKNKISL